MSVDDILAEIQLLDDDSYNDLLAAIPELAQHDVHEDGENLEVIDYGERIDALARLIEDYHENTKARFDEFESLKRENERLRGDVSAFIRRGASAANVGCNTSVKDRADDALDALFV